MLYSMPNRTKSCLALLLSLVLVAPAVASDRAKFSAGVQLLREGKPVQALANLTAAEKSYPEGSVPVELLADLALAAWHSGESGRAETYAERAAARDSQFAFLRDTIVGAARLEDARAAMAPQAKGQPGHAPSPQAAPDIAKAKEHVDRSVASFERAVGVRPGSKEARNNLERALLLKKKIEELEKQQKDKKKDDDKKNEKKKKDDKKKDDQKDKKKDDQKKAEQPPKPKPNPQKDQKDQKDQKPQKKQKQQKQNQQKQGQQKQGQQKQGQQPAKPLNLSEEQKKRLLERLQQLIQEKLKYRRKLVPKHQPGKRDW